MTLDFQISHRQLKFYWSIPLIPCCNYLYTISYTGLKTESHPPKNGFYLLQWKPFKNDKKVSYFMLNASFALQIFLGILENSLRRKLALSSKFMTSQSGQEITIIHILSNISGSKVNQTMKLQQLIYWKSITSELFFLKIRP